MFFYVVFGLTSTNRFTLFTSIVCLATRDFQKINMRNCRPKKSCVVLKRMERIKKRSEFIEMQNGIASRRFKVMQAN